MCRSRRKLCLSLKVHFVQLNVIYIKVMRNRTFNDFPMLRIKVSVRSLALTETGKSTSHTCYFLSKETDIIGGDWFYFILHHRWLMTKVDF